MHQDNTSWPPETYRAPDASTFCPTLRDRTYQALRQVVDTKAKTLRQVAHETGLEWGWVRLFAAGRPANPGVNNIETLYYYLTGNRL